MTPRPLHRRLAVVMAIVALVTVVVTLLAGYQIVTASERQGARRTLSEQARTIAAARPAVRAALVANLSALENPAVLVATVRADGTVSGDAAQVVPQRVLRRVRAGRTVSTTTRVAGTQYLIEAVPVRGGGSVLVAQDLARSGGLGPQLALRLLLALGIGLVVAVLAAAVASRALTRPLTRLRDQAVRLAAGGREVEPVTSDIAEVVEVERAFGALAAALRQSEDRQREFLLSISHELRTPLTALRGYAEALADGVVPAADVPGVGRTLTAEAERLGAFTEDLLALARLEADDFPIELAPVALDAVLAEAARAWDASATAAGVEVVVAAPPVEILADRHRIRQLVDGLVENALRVSGTGTRITLSGGSDGARAWIEVADTGPGITADDAQVAFERGRLRDRYRDVRTVGTGLGLSIASRLATRLGGSVAARPGDGVGAVFRIDLPGRDLPG